MAISLKKNAGIKLSKDNEGLKMIRLGLGWDESKGYIEKKAVVKKRSFFGFGKETNEVTTERVHVGSIDLDATILAVKGGRVIGECSYRSTSSAFAKHSGDDTTGGSNKKGDDERIDLYLSRIDNYADAFYLVLNVFGAYNRQQTLDMVQNAYVKVYDDKNEEMASFDLTENYSDMTGCIVGKVIKGTDGFEFIALGDGVKVRDIDEITKKINKY